MVNRERLPLLALSFIAVIAGVWLGVSPWVLAEQSPSAPWSHDTTTHVVTGLILVLLGALEAYAATKPPPPVTACQADDLPAAGPDPDPLADDRLVLLATALLRDLESKTSPQASAASPGPGVKEASKP